MGRDGRWDGVPDDGVEVVEERVGVSDMEALLMKHGEHARRFAGAKTGWRCLI
jgi:hypothetical protein